MPQIVSKKQKTLEFASGRDASDSIDLQIQEKLRQSFSDVLTEPIPDRFLKLLDRLSDGKPQ